MKKSPITTRLPQDLLKSLRDKAEQEATTVTELITRYIKSGLSAESASLEKLHARLSGVEKKVDDTKQSVEATKESISVTTATVEKIQEKIQNVEKTAELTAKWAAISSNDSNNSDRI